MKILIIEDEHKTSQYLKKGFEESGFTVDISNDGREGLFMANEFSYDIIILDIMLPGCDGFTIIKSLRQSGKTVRVLFLSARDDIDDKVKGLELGADDYLAKPFSFAELLARVRTLLRRDITRAKDSYQIADLKIDLLKRKVMRGNSRIDLTAKEFALLQLFFERQGEVLSRTFIAEAVWDIHFDSDTNVIDVAIKRLRQKIDNSFEKKLIHTERGMGYVIEAR